jgi:hypothetical protein
MTRSMTRKHGLAKALSAASAAGYVALASACGVSQGGLGSVPVDDTGTLDAGDPSLNPDGAGDTMRGQEDAADAAADGAFGATDSVDALAWEGASPLDATLVDGEAGDGDGDLEDAGKSPDAGQDAGPLPDATNGGGSVPDAEVVSDGGTDTGLDSHGMSDSGDRDVGGSDSEVDGSAVDAGDATSLDAGVTCDFGGTWGSRIHIDVSWTPQGITGILLASGSGTISQWILSTRTLNGANSTDSAVLCGIDLPDFDGTAIAGGEVYGIRFPNSLFDNSYIPAFVIQGTFSGASPSATYNTSPAAVLLGLTLTNPTTDPWPTTITTEVDMDHDGKPGVTANALQGNGYTYPPVDLFKANRAQQLYVAIRQITQISALASDCDHVSGTVAIPSISDPSSGTSKPAIDSHVIGCKLAGPGAATDCNSTQASFVDNTQPVFTPNGGSSFTSVRMAAGSTCAQVRQTLL